MTHVVVYVTRICSYCTHVKRLLGSKGIRFEEVDVSNDLERRRWLVAASGQRTVPQVFVDGRPYGGFTDLLALEHQGKLDAILGLTPD